MPEFDDDGVLPPGDYKLTPAELVSSMLVEGPETIDVSWDRSWRKKLAENACILIHQLWEVGITEIYLDGSFAEDKLHPNDIDGYFACELNMIASGELERRLNSLDPFQIWTWDPALRRRYRGYPKLQLPMWHQYRVELYPHVGQLCGIRDEFGNELDFPAAFRRSRRDGRPKGIVKIVSADEGAK